MLVIGGIREVAITINSHEQTQKKTSLLFF